LYFTQYGGTEFPARLDQVFARDTDERVVVARSRIDFTEQLRFGDTLVEPSDHYAVIVELVVSP